LSGISPFLGDNDTETVRNVILGNYTLDCDEFAGVSNEAKDFVSKLLVLEPSGRLTVDEALQHPWLSKKSLENAPLTSACLREFKYRHKWLVGLGFLFLSYNFYSEQVGKTDFSNKKRRLVRRVFVIFHDSSVF
ncbi:unnamed protein product, partial [Gongylonema pulchrum]|uniref:Protein kinase domain-containing protein n=1 Tax=Gongylonema pulchrum TaxID=637853 RepID=A0A183CW05_9BILA